MKYSYTKYFCYLREQTGKVWPDYPLLVFYLLSFILTLFLTACLDDDTQPEECGPHQIMVDGDCQCEDGYHWNDDYTNCVLDTTSHNFVWTIDTLGEYSSYLNDVWIVDENDIWVVGNIVMPDPDSSFDGTGQETFNIAHWDGSNWGINRAWGVVSLSGIWYFSIENIWVSCGFPIHWDGDEWKLYHLQNMGLGEYMSVDHIWASSEEDIYFVGYKGSIAYYNGSNFSKMESGTKVRLRDIAGSADGEHIFVTGYEDSGELSGQSVALELVDGQWRKLYTSTHYSGDPQEGDYGRFQAVTVLGDTAYFTTGGTWLVKYNFIEQTTEYIAKREYFTDGYRLIAISGSGINDILLTSAWGNVFHYNGSTWKLDNCIYDQYGPAALYPRAGKIKGNTVVIASWLASWEYAPVIRGYR